MPKNSDFQGLYCFSYSLIAHLPLRKGCWMLSPLHNFLQNCLSQVQVCSQTHQPCECKEKAIFPLTQPWEKCLGILQYQEGCWSWMELSGKVQYYPPPQPMPICSIYSPMQSMLLLIASSPGTLMCLSVVWHLESLPVGRGKEQSFSIQALSLCLWLQSMAPHSQTQSPSLSPAHKVLLVLSVWLALAGSGQTT